MKITLAILLILAMCGGLLFSCGANTPFSLYTYENAAQYTAGGGTLYTRDTTVHKLDIDWRSGSVTIGLHDEDYVSITEDNAPALGSGNALHYWLDGDTLRIRFAKSGHLGTTSLRDKDLTVLLPRETILRNLSIETVSADISLQDITADDFELESVSGNMELLDASFSDEMDAETVSGNVSISSAGNVGSLDVETTSGIISAAAQSFDSIDLSSVSGKITVKTDSLRRESSLESVSGKVELYLASDGFTARISTISGAVHSDYPCSKADNIYICGSGGPELDIETVSGNVELFSLN